MSKNVPVVFDFEGPLANPAINFAWMSYNAFVSGATKERFPAGRIREFDEWDDAFWEACRNVAVHSTGATPLVIDCVLAMDQITDKRLIELARQKVQLNPGVPELLRELAHDNFYIITSSHPAAPLVTAKEYDVHFGRVSTHGFQQVHLDDVHYDLEVDVGQRSPLQSLANYRDLANFLSGYLDVCSEILAALKTHDYQKMLRASAIYRNAFWNNDPTIQYLFSREEGIMGGHRKAQILQKIAPDTNVAFFGDGIVDADGIKFAKYGTSLNCTNDQALLDSKINFITIDMSTLLPVIEDIRAGRFDAEHAAQRYSGMQVFTPPSIQGNLGYVKAANSEAKEALKQAYSK